jgi:Icc protein
MEKNLDRSDFVLIAHLTDTHLFAESDRLLVGIPTDASFKAVLAEITQTLPDVDLLLLTGDLSQDGSIESYQRMRNTLDSHQIPAYCLAGNHDDLSTMQKHLPSEYVSLSRSQNIGNWKILLLSSVVVGAVHGYFAEAELTCLEEQLNSDRDRPTLIAFHHPAVAIGSPWMDGICLTNQEQFWEICDRYQQIKVVLSGHAHQDFDQIHKTLYSSVRCLVSPSTCVQFRPQTPTFQVDELAPAFRHLRLYADGSFQTEVHRLKSDQFSPDLQAANY